ncbi:MAG TPA: hypothetical protein VGQ83_00790 [Polyangia bacterium]|jgi:hypothetical protein
MHRIAALVIALALAALGGCFTTVDQGPPPAAPPPPPPPAEPVPEPVAVPVAAPEPAPPAVIAVADYCLAFAGHTCNRLGACGALPMPVPQCVGELNGLCQQRAGATNVAAIGAADAANCFAAIGIFGCRDFARAHGKGRVVKACTQGSLKPLFRY